MNQPYLIKGCFLYLILIKKNSYITYKNQLIYLNYRKEELKEMLKKFIEYLNIN